MQRLFKLAGMYGLQMQLQDGSDLK